MGGCAHLRLLRFRGVNVWFHLSWYLVLAAVVGALTLFYFPARHPSEPVLVHLSMALGSSALLAISMLLHEMAHVLAAQYHHIPIAAVILGGFGGVTYLADEKAHPSTALLIATVGPLTHLFLAGVLAAVAHVEQRVHQSGGALQWAAQANLLLAILNALPAFPLDGGRMLHAMLWWAMGSLSRATKTSMQVGRWTGLGLMTVGAGFVFFEHAGVGLAWLITGWLIRRKARTSGQERRYPTHAARTRVAQVMQRSYVSVPGQTSVAELITDPDVDHHTQSWLVLRDGRYLGILTPIDLSRVPRQRWSETRVDDIVSSQSISAWLDPQMSLLTALQRFSELRVNHLPVLEGCKLVGIVARQTLYTHLHLTDRPQHFNSSVRRW